MLFRKIRLCKSATATEIVMANLTTNEKQLLEKLSEQMAEEKKLDDEIKKTN